MLCRTGEFFLRRCYFLCRNRTLLSLLYLIVLVSALNYVFWELRALIVWQSGLQNSTPQSSRELVQLHVVFKHGHRSPFRLYKTDPNPREIWPEGLGQLTQLGRLQMYQVGVQLRQRYKDFLTHDPNEIYLQSSDANRSLYSAYSFLAGFYPPDEEWAFAPDLPWQPIDVKYVPEEKEMYLQSNPNCPKYETSKKQTIKSEEVQAFIRQHKGYYEFWRRHSGNPVNNCDTAGDLYKTLSVEMDNNYTIPEWAARHWDELIHQTDVCYYYHFKTKLQQRFRAGPILGLMLNRMKARTRGVRDFKVYGYSGHGSNIAAMQCALQSYIKHAPHAATLVQELHAEPDGSFTTRFLLFNSTHPESQLDPPFAIQLHVCSSQFCPIDIYDNFIKELVPKNWEKECKDDEEFPDDTTPSQHAEYVEAE